jgi:hypothetical protein
MRERGHARQWVVFCGLIMVALAAAGCGDGDDGSSSSAMTPILFSAEGEDLNAYDSETLEKQVVISGNEDESDPNIPAVNGQICFDPT